ncbi:structural maintenance of chromosomes protein 5-like isoform X2 [Watersipora subatra]|uniref:structural maintenance of chromosomes protein 5-like isoform X2 n=1 Tax=Watersipora subatra TaxID=2589382 RepID=UPI00355B2B10
MASTSMNQSLLFESEFTHGAIREITLSNFLIYDYTTVKPGPHLNVIIGPNATGKSTIVNAICLGLAGKASILGRAKDLSSFIKNGCNKATIQIELHNSHENEKNYHLKRVILRNSAPNTNWFINGKSAQLKQVEELVASLDIQVSNLCQFLPQDRVADFVKMTNTELLLNTMLAADKNLYDIHAQLKEAQKKSNNLLSDFSKNLEQLEREKKLNAALEKEVGNIEERQEFERKKNDLLEKRPWEYEEYRQLHITQKAEKEAIEKRREEVLALNAPAQHDIDLLKEKLGEKTTSFRDMGQKILNVSRDVSSINESMQLFTEKVEEAESALKSKENEEKLRIKRVEAIRTQIQALTAQRSNMEEINLAPEIAKTDSSIQQLNTQKYECEDEIRTLSAEKENKRLEIIAIESELKRIRDIDSQKLNMVNKRDRDTYNAIMWLRGNRSKFEGIIYEPPLMTLNVRDRANAKYIENSISFNNMKTFICMKSSDHEKFYRQVREEHGLIINAAVILHENPDRYQPPSPIHRYSHYGFHSYLKDMVEAPDPVLAYLCELSQLHKIPVGDRRVNSYIDEIPQQCSGITRYMSDSHSYSYTRSLYGDRNVLTRSVDLRPARLLIHSIDESKLTELTSNLKVLKREEDELSKRIQELTVSRTNISERLEEAKQRKKDLLKKQGERKAIEEKLKLKKASLSQLEEENVINIEEERASCERRCAEIYADRLKAFCRQAHKTKVVLTKCKERCKLGLESYAISEEIRHVEANMTENNLLLVGLESELAEKKEQLARTKDTARKLQREAKKAVGDPSGLSEVKQQIFKQLPSTLEEIDAMIADLQARIDLLFVDNDENVLQIYNDRKKLIERLEAKLAGREASQSAQRDEISQLKETFLPPLKAIISTINAQFGEYFRQINCAGEIELKVPANPHDFDNYGIGINVKYGDNKPMKELTTFQSGGERSVATVLYMLSLQELSRSPFRCVDEINQGMDAQNERRVFELVVNTACKPTSPQYFLLTPKLLPDLLYTDRMKIHIVHNGPYMLDHSHWNFDDFIVKRGEFAD